MGMRVRKISSQSKSFVLNNICQFLPTQTQYINNANCHFQWRGGGMVQMEAGQQWQIWSYINIRPCVALDEYKAGSTSTPAPLNLVPSQLHRWQQSTDNRLDCSCILWVFLKGLFHPPSDKLCRSNTPDLPKEGWIVSGWPRPVSSKAPTFPSFAFGYVDLVQVAQVWNNVFLYSRRFYSKCSFSQKKKKRTPQKYPFKNRRGSSLCSGRTSRSFARSN